MIPETAFHKLEFYLLKFSLRHSLALAVCLLVAFTLYAQPPVCAPPAATTPFCSQACIICDIDGFSGTNDDPPGGWDEPNGFCAQVYHNMQWIGFLADSVDPSFQTDGSGGIRLLGEGSL